MPEKGKAHKRKKAEHGTSAEQTTYKGRAVVVKSVDDRPELYIDGKRVVTVRDRSGRYFAARFAYILEPSLVGVAKRLIDYEEALQKRRSVRGRTKKSGMSQRG